MTCIYIIQNKINNKFYLGSTVNFINRRRTHLRELKSNKHHCIALQRAVNKYGLINFEFRTERAFTIVPRLSSVDTIDFSNYIVRIRAV